MSKSSILFWRGVHCFIIKRTSKAPHKIETLTARLFNGCEGLQSAVCFGLRKPSDNEHMLFPPAGVLMVCHVNVCALFKVITPLQSATVTQLLTSWPCIFHVLLLVKLSSTRAIQRCKKASAGRKNKTCSIVCAYSRHATYLGTRPLLRSVVPGSEMKPTTASSSHVGCLSGR